MKTEILQKHQIALMRYLELQAASFIELQESSGVTKKYHKLTKDKTLDVLGGKYLNNSRRATHYEKK